MRIHHLDCGSHCPLGGALFDGVSRGFKAEICTHCLLIELADHLVLVDTGYGLQDIHHATGRLARLWPFALNVQLRETDTAIRQIEALGFSARDVRHIILTHLDFDHAGGIEDFPQARVHVMAVEKQAAEQARRGFIARQRYRPLQWDDVRDWRTYTASGESWFDFDAVRDLDGLPPEILMVPLRGHTLGHAGIALDTGQGWLLDAGDAFMHHGQLETPRNCPPGLSLYQAIMTSDRRQGSRNLDRLRDLQQQQRDDVRIFAAHDTAALKTMQTAQR